MSNVREEILEILRQPHNKRPPRNNVSEQRRQKQADELLKIVLREKHIALDQAAPQANNTKEEK